MSGDMTTIGGWKDLLDRARAAGPVPVVLAGAESESGLRAVAAAVAAGIADPVLVGDKGRIRHLMADTGIEGLEEVRYLAADGPERAASAAVKVAVAVNKAGGAVVLLKGSLRTDQLMRAALDKEHGLRAGRLISDVLLYEDTVSGQSRLVGVTDGGINPAPDLAAMKQIVGNAVEVFRALGFVRPRVALLSATEAVRDAVPSSVIAHEVAEWASVELPHADVAGPLALDNALLQSAAAAKGITGPVAGRADILVAPGIDAGNLLGKAVKYLAGSITAHVVVGARVPILTPSRVESPEDKLHSIALGVLLASTEAERG